MNKFLLSFLVIAFFVVGVSAQSGRRIKTVEGPKPAATPSISITSDETAQVEEMESVGYSDSAPSSPRTIYSSRRREAKESKKSKKQAKKTEQPQPNAQAVPASSEGEDEVLKVETSLISIPVSVFNRNGIYVSDLQKESFKIFENGVEHEVAYFGKSDKPFTVILLIDVSPSTQFKIEEIQDAAIAFVNQLSPRDSVMVIQFDDSVKTLSELTNDRNKIINAIRRTGFGGGTSLYEAVDNSLRKRFKNIEGRKAIVLFTDGVDTTSLRASFEDTLAQAEESEAIIFPIYYNTYLDNLGIGGGGVMSSPPVWGTPQSSGRGSSSAEYARGRAYLEALASATGGRVFKPENSPTSLTNAFEGIAEELRSQYNLGYYPQTEGAAGERKQIKVRVNRPRLVVRARDSYIVGSSDTQN